MQPLNIASVPTPFALAVIVLAAAAGLMWMFRHKLRASGPKKEQPDDIQIPPERDPQGRGGEEPEMYASSDEIERLYNHNPRFLASRIDRFLEQDGSEEVVRQFVEDHEFWGVNRDGKSASLHFRVFTDKQLAALPVQVRRDIESERLKRGAGPMMEVAVGGAPATNGHGAAPSAVRRGPGRPPKPRPDADSSLLPPTDEGDEN